MSALLESPLISLSLRGHLQAPNLSKANHFQQSNECKRRKVKCDGEEPCDRCIIQNAECSYTYGAADWSDVERMGTEMRTMRESLEQVMNQLNSTHQLVPSDLDKTHGPEDSNLPELQQHDTAIEGLPQTSPSPSSPCHGPTSSGFAIDVARERLETLGLDSIMPGSITAEDLLDLGNDHREFLGSYRHLIQLLKKDPLWNIDTQEVYRLIDVFANGVGAMFPVVDFDKLRSKWASLTTMISSAKARPKNEGLFLTAEAMFNADSNILKLVMANSLTAESGGMNDTAKSLFSSTGSAHHTAQWDTPNLKNITMLLLTGVLYYHLDDEMRGGRVISVAVRQCLEMGLHRNETYQRNIIHKSQQSAATALFWSIYVLERRSCIGLGVPFIMQDSDIDPTLPRPTKHLYLDAMIVFTKLSGNACRRTSLLRDRGIPFPVEEVDYHDYMVVQWHKQLAPALTLNTSELQTSEQPHLDLGRSSSSFLSTVLLARYHQLRNLIYRPVLYSPSRIAHNERHAQVAVDIARESVQFLTLLNRTTNFVQAEPLFFRDFLISAFATILLATSNAPTSFSHQLCEEFYMVLDLFRDLSSRSPMMARVWNSVKFFEIVGPKLGLLRSTSSSSLNNISKPTNQNSMIYNQLMDLRAIDEALRPRPEENVPASSLPASWNHHERNEEEAGMPFSTFSFPTQLRNELSLLSSDPMADLVQNFSEYGLPEDWHAHHYWS